MKKYIIFTISLLALCSCVSNARLGSFTALSTRNIATGKVDANKMPQTRNTVGRDSRYILFGIPLGFPILANAVDDALESGGGDLLIDASLHYNSWYFLFFGEQRYEAKGSVINTRGVVNE